MPRDKDDSNGESASRRFVRRLAETPIFAILPRWCLSRWAVPISREGNAAVLTNVLEVFEPSLRPFLTSVPIILDTSATTARAYPAQGYIGVSPDWDHTVYQSDYRVTYEQREMAPDEAVFAMRFKTNLLIHEYLHILQYQLAIDNRSCYEAISSWYLDPRYGRPDPQGVVRLATNRGTRSETLANNRMKYVLWHQLYNYQGLDKVPQDMSWKNMQYLDRYRSAKRGVEEFAYIGEEILASGSDDESYIQSGKWSTADWQDKKSRLPEVTPEIIALYRGVFNPKLAQ